MATSQKNWFKFTLGIIFCFLFRLLPFRPPNVEPILATQMPFSRAYGALAAFFFGVSSVLIYDVLTGTLGLWTFLTAGAYGALGLFAFYFFKKKEPSRRDYALFAVIGTLFFDAVTGLTIGPLLFHQSLLGAFAGQIPFTFWHLLGNVGFSIIVSPAIYKVVKENKKSPTVSPINIFKPVKII